MGNVRKASGLRSLPRWLLGAWGMDRWLDLRPGAGSRRALPRPSLSCPLFPIVMALQFPRGEARTFQWKVTETDSQTQRTDLWLPRGRRGVEGRTGGLWLVDAIYYI